MNVTLTHPISNFTGNVNFQDGAAILGFTAGTCSVDLDPKFFNAVAAYGITITIGTPGPAPAYDANYDVVTKNIVSAPGSQTTGALKAAYGRAAPVLSAFSYDAATGNLLSYQEDGIPITLTYNADGTVATSKRGTDTTQTYSYSGGNLVGVA